MWPRISNFVFGEKVEGDLPARVREEIAARQIEGERLVGWAQLVLVVLFGTLYAVAPTPAEMAPFRLEPWVLAVYCHFFRF